MVSNEKMTAYEVMDRLAEKHIKDVFVPECKDGPTYTGSHLRLDAWAMLRSWTNYRTFGYEVKVSRSDFLHDDKMQGYMPLCHEFYVVCPAGVVNSLDELPDGAGLMISSPNHRRLITKKKAKFRDVPDPVMVYRYILMARARIDRDGYYMEEGKEIFWRAWLERKEYTQRIGHMASKSIGEVVKKRIEEVESENKRLQRMNEGYSEIKAMLENLDIKYNGYNTWGVKDRLEAYKKGFPEELRRSMQSSRREAEGLIRQIDEATKALEAPCL